MASNVPSTLPVKKTDNEECSYHLVWLDKNLDNFGTKVKVKRLREIDPDIETFVSGSEFLDYIRKVNNQKLTSRIVFITSGAMSERVIPKIQDYPCVFAIFIFCTHAEGYEHLKYQKLQAIHTDIYELMDDIEMYIAKFNDTTDFSVFIGQHSVSVSSDSEPSIQCSIRNLKEDLASFLWFRQMHEFMVTLDNHDDQEAKAEMVKKSREEYPEKKTMQSRIDEFNVQPLSENKENAIHWYTANCFIYRCTNTVLRKENISQVYAYRYIIKLICQQLKELHKQFLRDYRESKLTNWLRLYRGQYFKLDQIELLKKNIDNLISLNGFVSTTMNRKIAIQFINRSRLEDFEPVLFEIDVDMTNEYSVAFADISNLSNYPEEEEVLLSIGSVFSVKSVELIDIHDQLKVHVIRLVLKQDNQFTVTKYIERTYAKNTDSADRAVLFGKLLFDMGETESAAEYFRSALNRLTDINNHLRPIYLNNLGVCYTGLNRNSEALTHYQRALRIYEANNDKRGISACQHNIASIYHANGDHPTALCWALEALDVRQNYHLERASTLDLLGCIYLARCDYDAAYDKFDEALKLRLKYLGRIDPNHPDIGVSHHNLGKVSWKIAKRPEARTHYSKAAEIYRHNYPSSYHLVVEITKCLQTN